MLIVQPGLFVCLFVCRLFSSERLFLLFIALNSRVAGVSTNLFTCVSQSFNVSYSFPAGFSQDFLLVLRGFSHDSHSNLLSLNLSSSKPYSAQEVTFNSKGKVALTRYNVVHVCRYVGSRQNLFQSYVVWSIPHPDVEARWPHGSSGPYSSPCRDMVLCSWPCNTLYSHSTSLYPANLMLVGNRAID